MAGACDASKGGEYGGVGGGGIPLAWASASDRSGSGLAGSTITTLGGEGLSTNE